MTFLRVVYACTGYRITCTTAKRCTLLDDHGYNKCTLCRTKLFIRSTPEAVGRYEGQEQGYR